jgi:NADH:ubiquinone oxidoreductase subunit 6 (subunit J)
VVGRIAVVLGAVLVGFVLSVLMTRAGDRSVLQNAGCAVLVLVALTCGLLVSLVLMVTR